MIDLITKGLRHIHQYSQKDRGQTKIEWLTWLRRDCDRASSEPKKATIWWLNDWPDYEGIATFSYAHSIICKPHDWMIDLITKGLRPHGRGILGIHISFDWMIDLITKGLRRHTYGLDSNHQSLGLNDWPDYEGIATLESWTSDPITSDLIEWLTWLRRDCDRKTNPPIPRILLRLNDWPDYEGIATIRFFSLM